jgi:hypothetical protein
MDLEMPDVDSAANSNKKPMWIWIPSICLVSILVIFLMSTFFFTPSLTDDQRNVIRLLFALLAGFSTLFIGGTCLLQFDIPTSNGGKFGLSATGGVAVFIFTYMYPPYWYTPNPSPDREVAVSLISDSKRVLNDFDLTYRIGARVRRAIGKDGRAILKVPAETENLQDIEVEIPCYSQISNGPFKIVEGKEIEVKLSPIKTPTPDPIPPTVYPDPTQIIPSGQWPSRQTLASYDPTEAPETFVIEHENKSSELVHLLVFNFARFAENRNPWRVFHMDPCEGPRKYSGFQESKGLVALFAMSSSNSRAEYLGNVDLYAHPLTVLKVKENNRGFAAEITQK